jgi:glycosidase
MEIHRLNQINSMKNLSAILTFLIFSASIAKGQMITTDPAVPVMGQEIKIYFDATNTAAGDLKNFDSDLYAHTGVTIGGVNWKNVIGTWAVNSSQPKLKYLGNNKYELDITPDIKTFYSLSATDVATKICLVIRNSDGTKQTRPDIFIDVFPAGLNATFTLPVKFSQVANLNDQIPVKVAATAADSVSLYIGEKWIKHGSTASSLTHTIIADHYGEFWVKTIAWDLPKSAADSFFVYVREPLVTADLPAGLKDGINYLSDNSATLVLYAPYKEYVFAVGDFTGWLAKTDGYMKRTPDGQRYWVEIDGLESGKEYRFQYLVDSTLYIADPYSDKVLDEFNDQYISSETYPGLIPYPKDTTSGMVSVLQTAQTPYSWEVTAFEPPNKSKLIIYELLIRDFVAKHDFKTLIDTLSYLDDLGVNAIELMPVSEFEGNLSWGYNPSFYFASDKYYGPKNDMKAFVDSCHKRGIAVIMDMVLNHCNGQSPFVQLYLDHYGSDQIYMKTPNPWFNASSPNPLYKWGADFNHESLQTQKLVDRITSYWLTEYNIDGFRFDFTKGFTNTPGDGSSYDASRIIILKRMAYQIWSVNTNAYVILEHFAPNAEEIELANYGMLPWGNNNYNYSEAAMGYTSDLTSASYLGRGWSVPNLVTYMESHDEERLMYKTLSYGGSSGAYSTVDFKTALKRMQLDALFFFSLPGPKMIWQFGELGYDISIEEGGRTGEKPLKWDYLTDHDRFKLYMMYRTMIALKRTQPVFETTNFSYSLSSPGKRIRLTGTDNKVNILGNFGLTTTSINPSFPETGKWYEFFSGDSITVTNTGDNITLAPGEFRMYSTVKFPSVEILTDVEDIKECIPPKIVTVYPNPSRGSFNLLIDSKVSGPVSISVLDVSGRIIRQIVEETPGASVPVSWDGKTAAGQDASPGLYFIQVTSGLKSETLKVIKSR